MPLRQWFEAIRPISWLRALRALLLRLRTNRQRWSAALIAALLIFGCIAAVWMTRYALAIHRLTRGVGDTVFYSADGRPWFRMDEQRHDVPLAQIAADLQHAVIATEDHRFFRH